VRHIEELSVQLDLGLISFYFCFREHLTYFSAEISSVNSLPLLGARVVLIFAWVGKILMRDHSNEGFWVQLSCCNVCFFNILKTGMKDFFNSIF